MLQSDRVLCSPGRCACVTCCDQQWDVAGLPLMCNRCKRAPQCRSSCPFTAAGNAHDIIHTRLLARLSFLLDQAPASGCIARLLHPHCPEAEPRLATGLLIGSAELLQQAACGLQPDPSAQAGAASTAQGGRPDDQPGRREQFMSACRVLFSIQHVAGWPGGGTGDSTTLRRHLLLPCSGCASCCCRPISSTSGAICALHWATAAAQAAHLCKPA